MELNRWEKFNKREQLLMIGSEFVRAKNWQRKDQEKFLSALERALELIDLTLSDPKWENNLRMLLGLREEVAKFYTAKRTDDVSLLYNVL
jgi:hypothetical protein